MKSEGMLTRVFVNLWGHIVHHYVSKFLTHWASICLRFLPEVSIKTPHGPGESPRIQRQERNFKENKLDCEIYSEDGMFACALAIAYTMLTAHGTYMYVYIYVPCAVSMHCHNMYWYMKRRKVIQ